MLDVPAFRRFSICAFVAFSPAILAYGRVLGSSWQALKQSSQKIAQGEASPFHNHKPSPKQQAIAQIVNINLAVMPFVALNTVISLLALSIYPDLFSHSQASYRFARIPNTVIDNGRRRNSWFCID